MKIQTRKIPTTSLKYKLYEQYHKTFSTEITNLPQGIITIANWNKEISTLPRSLAISNSNTLLISFRINSLAMVWRNKTYPVTLVLKDPFKTTPSHQNFNKKISSVPRQNTNFISQYSDLPKASQQTKTITKIFLLLQLGV